MLKNAEFGWAENISPMGKIKFNDKVLKNFPDVIKDISNHFSPFKNVVSIHSLYQTNSIVGSYCIETSQEKWFVRISSRTGDVLLEKEIIDYLSHFDFRVNRLCFSKTLEGDDHTSYRLDVRPFIEGRHFTGSLVELETLAFHLSQLHKAFEKFPGKKTIRQKAIHRYKRLEEINHKLKYALNDNEKDFFHEKSQWAERHLPWLNKMANQFRPKYYQSSEAQPLHGEIHPGNIIFSDTGPVFIDFEESVHGYAPPIWDLAYLIQRFCLWGQPSKKDMVKRFEVVRLFFPFDLKDLQEMMRQTAFLSMAAILDLRHNHQIISPKSEYDKFVELESQADQMEFLF